MRTARHARAGHRLTHRRRGAAGFTLVEMLVVLAIIGLVFAVVLVARPKSASLRMEALARSVVAAMRRARDDAMMGNIETSFVIDGAAHAFGRRDALNALPADLSMNATVAAGERRGTSAGFIFYPDGRSTGGTLVLATGAAHTTIDVDWLTGLAKIRR